MAGVARDAFKLALPGCRHSVEWWGLPTRLEWALAPDRGALGYQTGSLAARMAFGRLRGPWVQELKSSSLYCRATAELRGYKTPFRGVSFIIHTAELLQCLASVRVHLEA